MKGETALRKLTRIKNGEEVPLHVSASKTKESTFDRIFKFYHDKKTRVELTEKEDEIRNRLEKAWFLLCNKAYSNKMTVDKLCKLFSIDKSMAYDDLRNAMILFSDPRQDVKEGKRRIHEHQILKGARMALKEKDFALHEKYMKQYAEVNGLFDNSAADPSEMAKKFKPHKIVIVAKMQDLMAEAEKLREDITLDVEHEEG
jgi:hypothetical protein